MRNTEAVRREEEKVGKFGREQAINTCVNEAPAFDSRYGDGPDFVCKCCSILAATSAIAGHSECQQGILLSPPNTNFPAMGGIF